MSFDPWNYFLKIWESIKTPTPKVGAHLGVCGFIPLHSPTLSGMWMWFPGCFLGPHLSKPLPWSRAQGLSSQHPLFLFFKSLFHLLLSLLLFSKSLPSWLTEVWTYQKRKTHCVVNCFLYEVWCLVDKLCLILLDHVEGFH
jgi:hypothetical protein